MGSLVESIEIVAERFRVTCLATLAAESPNVDGFDDNLQRFKVYFEVHST